MSGGARDPAEGAFTRLFLLATGEEEARLCRDIPEDQCREQPLNFLLQALAQALSKTGDVLADPKIVLPWLIGAIGAPVFLVGLLTPVRESLALAPQILIGGMIRRFPVRKGFWAASAVAQGLCVVLMGVIAALGFRGAGAGWAVVGLLAVFSLARAVGSIASKDTLGKTVSKGRRGRVGGYAATVSGVVAAAVGLYLMFSEKSARPDWLLYAILIAAGCAWFAAAAAFTLIREYPGATEGGRGLGDLVRSQVATLFGDRELQKFLMARALLVSTALIGPVYVSLAQRQTGGTLDGLGWLLLASGLAGMVSSAFWGALSDRSSRLTMALAAGMAGALGFTVLATLALAPGAAGDVAFYAGVLFVLGVAHSGVRIGRKTQLVDLAEGDRKAEYVALSNTTIGVILIVVGGLVSALLGLGREVAIAALSVMSLIGAGMAMRMKNAQR